MADSVEGNQDLEVLFVQDGEPLEEPVAEPEPDAGKKILTQEEYESLVRQGQAAQTLAQPLEGLVQTLKAGREQQIPANMQQPGESEEEFWQRMENEAFVPGKFKDTMTKVMERQTAPIVNRMAQVILEQSKQLMRVDPERGTLFRKYEKEIVEEARNLPQSPDVYEKAYEKVVLRKQPEIFQEQMASMTAELEKKILEKYGIDPNTAQAKVQAQPGRKPVSALGNPSGVSGNESPQGTKIRLYESEKERMLSQGLDPSNPYAVQNWLKNHPRRSK